MPLAICYSTAYNNARLPPDVYQVQCMLLRAYEINNYTARPNASCVELQQLANKTAISVGPGEQACPTRLKAIRRVIYLLTYNKKNRRMTYTTLMVLTTELICDFFNSCLKILHKTRICPVVKAKKRGHSVFFSL